MRLYAELMNRETVIEEDKNFVSALTHDLSCNQASQLATAIEGGFAL